MTMKTYKVRVPEVHFGYVFVDARTPAHAVSQAIEGNATEDPSEPLDYGYTLEPDVEEWKVYEV